MDLPPSFAESLRAMNTGDMTQLALPDTWESVTFTVKDAKTTQKVNHSVRTLVGDADGHPCRVFVYHGKGSYLNKVVFQYT